MNVHHDLVIMVLPVWIYPRDISVTVLLVTLDFSVRRKIPIVTRILVPTVLCVKIYLDQETLNVCAERATREKTVTSQRTLVVKMETLAPMVPRAGPFHKEDLLVNVNLAGKEISVRKILMTVWKSPAYWVEIVQILSMISHATVPMDLLERDVKRRLICVPTILALWACVLIRYSDTNVYVSQGSLEAIAM